MSTALEELVAKERHRRERLRKQQRPMYWWQEGGSLSNPPEQDIWCEYCVAYYGVPHTGMHQEGSWCRFIHNSLDGHRVCACLDCVCAEKIGGPDSLASRITQA